MRISELTDKIIDLLKETEIGDLEKSRYLDRVLDEVEIIGEKRRRFIQSYLEVCGLFIVSPRDDQSGVAVIWLNDKGRMYALKKKLRSKSRED